MTIKNFFLVFLAVLFVSCSNGGSENEIVILSWNVQNFFDDVDNGTEYWEFDPSNEKWNYDLFNRKAAAIAEIIAASTPGGPDIVLLQEVENMNALELLDDGYLKSFGYEVILFMPTEGSAVGCGVLSRYPVIYACGHGVNHEGREVGRNIAEIRLQSGSDSGIIRIFVNHWKSKLGGAEETEIMRVRAASLLSSLIAEAAAGDDLIIAAGDFNESHDEYDRVNKEYRTAIMPFSMEIPEAPEAREEQDEGLYYSALVDDLIENPGRVLFNPWIEAENSGSYFYDGNWETIDQFFIGSRGFDNKGLEYSGFQTVELDINTTAEGFPARWYTTSGDGCSDHFPIMLKLKYAEPTPAH
jgi:endonuclease/exonuclease/phosphatase family metal-dependent hydrolase